MVGSGFSYIILFNAHRVGSSIPIYLWGNRPGALRLAVVGGNPRSALYVTSVLSLCGCRGLASNLAINVMNLVFAEAVWVPHSPRGLSDWPVPESLHL